MIVLQDYLYMIVRLLSTAFVITVILTFFYKRIANRIEVFAKPNYRSSHNKPTPTGGGIIISFIYIWSTIYFLFFIEQVPPEIFQISVGIAMGGIAITIVGFIDDVVETKALTKLLIQIMLSVWIVFVFLENLQTMFEVMSGYFYWPFILLALFCDLIQ